MQKANATDSLKEAIILLEDLNTHERNSLKEQVLITRDSLRPARLLKSALKEIASTPDTKTSIVDAAIGMTTGLITRKVLVGGSSNLVLKLLGSILQVGITNVVTKHPDVIKSTGASVFNKIKSLLGKGSSIKQKNVSSS